MAAKITIRALGPDDEAEWRALWTAYLAYYETDVSDEVKAETFRRLRDAARPEQEARVAAAGGRLVGLVHYIFHPHNWRIEPVCYLQDLYTLPEARGQGVGRALIEAVYAEADARGAPSVYWLTQHFNAPARRLYDRIGTLTPFVKYQR
jgi:GNAT superfamily N-acetyltransferase